MGPHRHDNADGGASSPCAGGDATAPDACTTEHWGGRRTEVRKYGFVFVVATFFGATAQGDLFFDDFQGDLSAWVGQGGLAGAHHGAIVDDVLNPGNKVLTFTRTNLGGDIFATAAGFSLASGQQYTVSFDYRGDPQQGGTPGNLGGYAGLSSGFAGNHIWYYGTSTVSGAAPVLVDDGQWRSYSYTFTTPLWIGNTIHLMFEDFWAAGYGLNNVAGDVYFDDVRLVPIPAAILFGMLGMGAASIGLRRLGQSPA